MVIEILKDGTMNPDELIKPTHQWLRNSQTLSYIYSVTRQ